jgi:1,4-alpha-glucan branching enzyme
VINRALDSDVRGHPGKKLLFMGQEFGQTGEWNFNEALPWWLLDHKPHQGLRALVRDLNQLYRDRPALHARDCEPEGFRWIVADDHMQSVLAFVRMGAENDKPIAVICNFTPEVRYGYRVGLPMIGRWREVLNTDAGIYGGTNVGNLGAIVAEPKPAHGFSVSAGLTLPPLSTLFLEFEAH